MKAYWAVLETRMKPAVVSTRRRRLAGLLRKAGIELANLRLGRNLPLTVSRLVAQEPPVIVALDDAHDLVDDAPWLAEMTGESAGLAPRRQPRVIYVTAAASAAGLAQALRHPLVRHYVRRDDKGRWVGDVALVVGDLLEQAEAIVAGELAPAPAGHAGIVGTSACFREAVEDLIGVLQSPCGLVSGEPGVGKMFLVRALWEQLCPQERMIVLPCGSFFKDYYLAGSRRRYGGGREAVDQLRPFLDEAQDGLLVLHQVQQLPTAVQEDLAARMACFSGDCDHPLRLRGVDRQGLQEADVRIVATSNFPPDLLARTGRLIPELADKLRKRHVRVPSLAERGPQDVELLCHSLLRQICLSQARLRTPPRQGRTILPRIEPEVLRKLAHTPWPGNVADLLRVLEHAVRRCRGGAIRLEHLPRELVLGPAAGTATLDEIVAQAQKTAIDAALLQTGGDVGRAADLLGRIRHALYRLMGKLGLTRARPAGE